MLPGRERSKDIPRGGVRMRKEKFRRSESENTVSRKKTEKVREMKKQRDV